jgi:iron complex outermembrane receptor protein
MNRRLRCSSLVLVVSLLLAGAGMPAIASAQEAAPLWQRPLDELMQVEVVSAGKKEQRVFEAPASVYVISRDEIERSGLTSVPDLLRLAPGLTVSRIDGSKWSVSVRGFAGRFANKLLVMIDGRSLYSRMFSGVFWDAIDVPVDEIERIEVIRGPGASLWGSNAVNGVINILTRSAGATSGTSVTTSGGLSDRWSAGASHSRPTSAGAVRVFGHASEHKGWGGVRSIAEDWRHLSGGLRFERGAIDGPSFILGANVAHSDAGQETGIFTGLAAPSVTMRDIRAATSAWSTTARWTLPVNVRGELQILSTYDGMLRTEPGLFRYERHIGDVSVQHRVGRTRRHDFVWGSGLRYLHDDALPAGLNLWIAEPRFGETLFSSFVQDEVSIRPDVKVTLGARVEHTKVMGWNVQPTARVWWGLDEATAIWGAASRAVRNPSRVEMTIRYLGGTDPTPAPFPIVTGFAGNPDAREETVVAYESGVRTTLTDRVALDVSGFFNRYDGLLTNQLLEPSFETGVLGPHLLMMVSPANDMSADTAGFETATSITVTPAWQVTGTVELFRVTSWRSRNPTDNPQVVNGSAPGYQASVRSSYSSGPMDFDMSVFRTASLPAPFVPAYTRVDARFAYRLANGLELALAAQNLQASRHAEAVTADLMAAAFPAGRTVSLRATWSFGRK